MQIDDGTKMKSVRPLFFSSLSFVRRSLLIFTLFLSDGIIGLTPLYSL